MKNISKILCMMTFFATTTICMARRPNRTFTNWKKAMPELKEETSSTQLSAKQLLEQRNKKHAKLKTIGNVRRTTVKMATPKTRTMNTQSSNVRNRNPRGAQKTYRRSR